MWRLVNRNPISLERALEKAEFLVNRYADNSAYELNNDPVVVRNIIRGIARNWVKYGLPYCPCKDISGVREQDSHLVCPCKDHHDEIATQDSCCCGLYQKVR